MANGDKFIIQRIRMRFADGTCNNIKTRKEVFNINSYREYLMTKHGAMAVEFCYETIPAESCGQLKVRIQ